MSFETCFRECFSNKDLLAEFDRLKGTNLSLKGTNFDLQVDFACGRFEGELQQFAEFVKECVWDRL